MPFLKHNLKQKSQRAALVKWVLAGSCLSLLAGCSTFGAKESDAVDCSVRTASCHKGRFGLVWKTTDEQGDTHGDSISGSYEWRSLNPKTLGQNEIAFLEVNSSLGPTLGSAKRIGDYYEVHAADGRVYIAQDWQTLFDLIFPVKLPAQALIQWMNAPNSDKLPELPPNWTWQNQNGRYRIVFLENNTSGRIDLIPQ